MSNMMRDNENLRREKSNTITKFKKWVIIYKYINKLYSNYNMN